MAKNLQRSGGRRNTGPGAHSLRLACTQGLPPQLPRQLASVRWAWARPKHLLERHIAYHFSHLMHFS